MAATFKGIIPPLITPLLDDNTIDKEGLERLVEHVITGGVHGLFILGTTGESQSLGFRLRTEMIRETSRIVNKRLPLLVGISDTSVEDSCKLANIAAEHGADAVVSAPPYYYASSQPELELFYTKLLTKLPLPLFLYNMPSHTKVSFAPSTIAHLAKHPGVIGFKDSSANGTYLQSVMYTMQNKPDFAIFVGPEEMTAQCVLMGASGGVNGGANLFPKLYVDLYHAAANRDLDTVRALQTKVMKISSSLYSVGKFGSSYLMGVKSALNVLGICSDVLAAPYSKFAGQERVTIERAVAEILSIL